MAPAWHYGPPLNIEEAFSPFPRRRRKIFRKERKSRRDLGRPCPGLYHFGYPAKSSGICQIPIRIERAIDGLGDPVDHDVCQNLVFSEAAFHVTVTIAPGSELFDDPGCESGWRIIQTES